MQDPILLPNADGFFYESEEAADLRRRKLLAAVRGWLREEFPLRPAVSGFLVACLCGSGGIAWLLHGRVFKGWGASLALAALAVWPLFLLFLRGFAAWAFRRFDLGDARWSGFAARDNRATGEETRELLSDGQGWFEKTAGNRWIRLVEPEGILLALGAVTVGGWLLWELIRIGPTVVAESVIDHHLLPAQPLLARQTARSNWLRQASLLTAFQFVGFALLLALFGFFMPFMKPALIGALAAGQIAVLLFLAVTRP